MRQWCTSSLMPKSCRQGVTDLKVANLTSVELHNHLFPRRCTFLLHTQCSADSLKRSEFLSREQLLTLLDVPGQKSATTPARRHRNWIWNISVADPWDCVSTRRPANCMLRMLTWASWKLVLMGAWLSLWWRSLMASHSSWATTSILMTTVTSISQTAAPSTSAGGLHLLYCPLLCPIAKDVLLRRHDRCTRIFSIGSPVLVWGFEVKVPWSHIWCELHGFCW